jgi:1,2-phenylacetyl-CoA epoxidase catalytic subunit
MTNPKVTGRVEFESLDGMSDDCAQGLGHLLWALADTKLLLGYHYGEWTFGTPELEAAVANCSLSQSELGHVRLLHALLKKHWGEDPELLVERRAPGEFANVASLDRPIEAWADCVAMNAVVDLAATRVLHALRGSAFKPLRMSVDKMLDEERHHLHHGRGWFRSRAGRGGAAGVRLVVASREALRSVAVWLGPAGDAGDLALVAHGVKRAGHAALFDALVADLTGLARDAGVRLEVARPASFGGWDARTRRMGSRGPADEIVFHLRGSANEIFKLGT